MLVVWPVDPAVVSSRTKVLPLPNRSVVASKVAELKQVPPVMVTLPVAEKRPCASGPVWVSDKETLALFPVEETKCPT